MVDVMGRNLAAGLPLHESVESAALATGDPLTVERARTALRAIDGGAGFSDATLDAVLFPVKRRVQVVAAERSGTLSDCLIALGVEYRERHHIRLKVWVSGFARGLTVLIMLLIAAGLIQGAQKAIFGPLDALGEPGYR